VPEYIAVPGNASVDAVVDHIEHIARITGKGQSVFSFLSEKKIS